MAVSRVTLAPALALVALVCCQFDESGLPHVSSAIDSGQIVDTPGPIDAAEPPDALRIDSAVPCVDDDGDSYFVPAVPDGECETPLDCDDADPRAHPGQVDYYDVPRPSGSFDFDCDGVESPIDGTLGEECAWDWFYCAGTGGLEEVPACGEEGTYHWCDPNWESCEESSITTGRMPCR
jgi:hypothetical protein